MNANSICCPFCNAPVPEAAMRATGPARCPRCGETIPGQWSGATSSSGPAMPMTSGPNVSLNRVQSKRKTAGIILAIMLAMAGIGAALALSTWRLRESRHPRLLPAISSPGRYAPAELPGLGYLPADTNVAAGIHVAEILRDKTAARLLEPPPGLLAQAMLVVQVRTGVGLHNIDHVVLGTTLKDEIPQLTIVVQTVQPYSLDALGRLYSQKPIPQHKQPLFRIKPDPVGGGYVWCADPRTLVIILRPDAAKIEDMDRIPATPRKGDEGLPQALRDLLEQRLRRSVMWAAGDLRGSVPETLATLAGTFPRFELVNGVRSFSFALSVQEEPTIVGAVQTHDADSRRRWKQYLEKIHMEGIKTMKVVEPTSPGPDRDWLSFQIRADVGGMRDLLDGRPAKAK